MRLIILKKIRKITKGKKNGFSILELVVSLGVFVIISTFLVNMTITVYSVALFLDKRSDILYEVISVTNFIRNKIKSSVGVMICNNPTKLVIFDENNSAEIIMVFNQQKNNYLIRITFNNSNNLNCNSIISNQNSLMLNSNIINITGFSLGFSSDGNKNSLIYVYLSLCDNQNRKPVVFPCNNTNNHYRHYFAMSTRNLKL